MDLEKIIDKIPDKAIVGPRDLHRDLPQGNLPHRAHAPVIGQTFGWHGDLDHDEIQRHAYPQRRHKPKPLEQCLLP